jgi:hypothetical protein
MTARLGDPAEFAGAFADEHSDLAPHMTLDAWRRSRRPVRHRSLHAIVRHLRARRRPKAPLADELCQLAPVPVVSLGDRVQQRGGHALGARLREDAGRPRRRCRSRRRSTATRA